MHIDELARHAAAGANDGGAGRDGAALVAVVHDDDLDGATLLSRKRREAARERLRPVTRRDDDRDHARARSATNVAAVADATPASSAQAGTTRAAHSSAVCRSRSSPAALPASALRESATARSVTARSVAAAARYPVLIDTVFERAPRRAETLSRAATA
jgi:hypothetical protein